MSAYMGNFGHLLILVAEAFVVAVRYVFYIVVRPREALAFFRSLGRAMLSFDHVHRNAKIATRPPETVFPGIGRESVCLADAETSDGNLSHYELYLLCALARRLRIGSALEFGTFNGLVTANLARNTSQETSLITLDLRPEDLAVLASPLAFGEECYVKKAQIGEKLAHLTSAERGRVTQLFGDSAQLDLSAYYGRIDMVFVDASHQYEYVKHDSEEAFKLRSPSGIILWHDYLCWKDVTRYLNELNATQPLVHLAGTSLVLYAGKNAGS